jgi:hypothetical protein
VRRRPGGTAVSRTYDSARPVAHEGANKHFPILRHRARRPRRVVCGIRPKFRSSRA